MPDFLTTYAQTQPHKMAVIEDRPDREIRSLTWSELNIQVNKLANVLLASENVEPGTKMVWCGPNSIGIVIMANAARKLGVTAVPLNYRLSDDEAAYVTDHSDATVVYVDAEYAKLFERIRNQLPKVNLILVYDGVAPSEMDSADELMSNASDQEPLVPLDREPGGTMIYTSGTTGKPKGALRTSPGSPEQGAALLAHMMTPKNFHCSLFIRYLSLFISTKFILVFFQLSFHLLL